MRRTSTNARRRNKRENAATLDQETGGIGGTEGRAIRGGTETGNAAGVRSGIRTGIETMIGIEVMIGIESKTGI